MVIVDVGANIGASAVFFKTRYPRARIYAFEPVPSNFDLLQRNTAEFRDVQVFREALSDQNGELELIHSGNAANEGGWGFEQPAQELNGGEDRLRVPMFESGKRLQDLGIQHIDILKLDTEGSESRILSGLGDSLLAKTAFIVGELHGKRDFALLDRLEQAGFDIEAKKTLGKRLFLFFARKRE